MNVTDLVFEIECYDGALHVLNPHFDSPISTATEECLRMIWVPFDGVDSQIVVLVRLQVQLLAALRA